MELVRRENGMEVSDKQETIAFDTFGVAMTRISALTVGDLLLEPENFNPPAGHCSVAVPGSWKSLVPRRLTWNMA
jgi:hypothetical protein